jgi:hypothetical protein
MKKLILLFISVLFSRMDLLGQFTRYNFSATNQQYLNADEAKLLNKLLNTSDTIHLQDKRIAFITGSSGRIILSKKSFFQENITPWVEGNVRPILSIVVLNEEERAKSGGYEVLVLSWVKVFTSFHRRRIVKKLAMNSPLQFEKS